MVLRELVSLDQGTLERVIGVGVIRQRCGRRDLTAAGLVLQGLLLGAAIHNFISQALGQ